MRYLPLLCSLLIAGTAIGASAASSYYINTNDPNAVAACTAQGGTVQIDAMRRQVCVIRQACAPASLPYTVNPNDPNAAQACQAACGVIAMNAQGQRVCVATSSMREPPNQR